MKKFVSVAALLIFVFMVSFSCSGPPKPTSEEEAVMAALKKLQDGVDSKISYNEFSNLLSSASSKIEDLKKAEKKSDCFMREISKCYSSYEIGQKAWKLKEEAEDQNRRMDMDTTLSFSMGFASVSLAKAGECFKK